MDGAEPVALQVQPARKPRRQSGGRHELGRLLGQTVGHLLEPPVEVPAQHHSAGDVLPIAELGVVGLLHPELALAQLGDHQPQRAQVSGAGRPVAAQGDTEGGQVRHLLIVAAVEQLLEGLLWDTLSAQRLPGRCHLYAFCTDALTAGMPADRTGWLRADLHFRQFHFPLNGQVQTRCLFGQVEVDIIVHPDRRWGRVGVVAHPGGRVVVDPHAAAHAVEHRLLELAEVEKHRQTHSLGEGLAQFLGRHTRLVHVPGPGLDVGGGQGGIVAGEDLLLLAQRPQHHRRLILLHLALVLGGQHLAGQVAVLLGRVSAGEVEMAVGAGDGHPQVEFRRLAHLLEPLALFLGELAHPLRVAGDAGDGQIPLRRPHHLIHPLLVGHQEEHIVAEAAVPLQSPGVVGDLARQFRGGGIGRCRRGGVVVQDDQFRRAGVVVHLARLLWEGNHFEDTALPDLANAPVQFTLGLRAADHPHLVGDDLVEGGLRLEPIAAAVPLEEPALVV